MDAWAGESQHETSGAVARCVYLRRSSRSRSTGRSSVCGLTVKQLPLKPSYDGL